MRIFAIAGLFVFTYFVSAAEPELKATAIVSAADHRGGAVSPGEIVVLYPTYAGPVDLVGLMLDQAGRAITALADTRVLFDGQPAPLIYAVQGEIGVVVPFEVEGRMSTSVVVEYQGKRSPAVSIPVEASKPALFTQNRVGTGQAGVLNDTGCCNSAANPAMRGTWVSVYATGTGTFQGKFPNGTIAAYKSAQDYPRPRLPVKLSVGGVPAELSFVGAAPHTVAGLLQINFRVPDNSPVGNAELVLSVGNAESTALATIAVRSAKRRILLASLAPAARKQWAARLARQGYEVVVANDGIAAGANPIDLAIVELPKTGMPPDWIASVTARSPGMKILVIGIQDDAESLRQADLMGANGFVLSSATPAAVLTRIRKLVQRPAMPYEAGPPLPFPGLSK